MTVRTKQVKVTTVNHQQWPVLVIQRVNRTKESQQILPLHNACNNAGGCRVSGIQTGAAVSYFFHNLLSTAGIELVLNW